MKRTIVAFVAGVALATAGSAYAEDIKTLIGKQIQGEIPVKINGEELDKKAIYVDGTSYLPVRAIGDALNMNVKYDALGVELTPKEGEVVDTTPESPVEVEPVPMSEEDAEAIRTSEQQILLSEQKIQEYNNSLTELREKLSVAESKIDEAKDSFELHVANMEVSSIKQNIEGIEQLLKVNEDNIPAQRAFIEKIKKKYE